MKFFVQTFGCIQNTSDSENIKNYYLVKGDEETKSWKEADIITINTCMIRQSAENRAYGFVRNCQKFGKKIIVTGCLVGVMKKNGQKNMEVRKNFPGIEFKLLDEFKTDWEPVKKFNNMVLIPISYGCNNMCSYCIVPQAKGREVSRKMEDVLNDVDKAIKEGNKNILLIGQNVNSYGADLSDCGYVSMGKKRFKSLFPYLLEEVAKKDLEKISFVSNNPWDFSDDLIEIMAKYKNIDRLVHLPFQAGDNNILKKMNRNYTKKEYLDLVKRIKDKVSGVRFSTDIIIGFPGETDEKFEETVEICSQVDFEIAYLNKYSPRPGTVSAKLYKDDIPMKVKKERWIRLNKLVNSKLVSSK
jgi:tRNA-2-methylthio-N6-dimethylallyladenosine synthase